MTVPKSRQCREEDCERAVEQDGYYCIQHIGLKRKCAARNRKTGELCETTAVAGTPYCQGHGKFNSKVTRSHAKAKALTTMQRFVEPYGGDIDPVSVFESEFRRTLGRIRWIDQQLAALDSEDDLIWGLTKEEEVNATEYDGTNRTYEARVHLLVEMQNWERKHLLDMEKVWIAARMDEQKLNLMKRYVEATYTSVVRAVTALGLDPTDPKVQEALSAALLDDQSDDGARRAIPAL